MIKFQVVFDASYDLYIVREVSNAYSFSMVAKGFTCEFEDKKKAIEQAARLERYQAKGGKVELQHIETPGCFEFVADKKYGCAW